MNPHAMHRYGKLRPNEISQGSVSGVHMGNEKIKYSTTERNMYVANAINPLHVTQHDQNKIERVDIYVI